MAPLAITVAIEGTMALDTSDVNVPMETYFAFLACVAEKGLHTQHDQSTWSAIQLELGHTQCPEWHIQCQRTNLGAKDGKDGLSMDEVGGAKVVKAAALEDLGASLKPHSLTEAEAVLAKDLGGHAPESAKHSPTSMDDLSLAVSLEGLGVSRKASSVLQAQSYELLIADFEEGHSDTQNRELRLQWELVLSPNLKHF
jgi:hypothetical protein